MAHKIEPQQHGKISALRMGMAQKKRQTVEKDVNALYWKLIRRFDQISRVPPILLNTSFNESEPIMNTPKQALDCFLQTQMDVLAIGSFFLKKTENLERSASLMAFAEQSK